MYPEKIKAWLSRSLDALAVSVEEESEDKQPPPRFIKMKKPTKRLHMSSLSSLSSDDGDTDYDNNNDCNDDDDDDMTTHDQSLSQQQQQHQQKKQEHLLSERLQNELEQTDSKVYHNVPWDISKSDMLIEVDDTLFPVEKNFIVYISEKFKTLINSSSSMQVDDLVFMSLSQYSVNEIQTVLTYMHSSDEAKLTGVCTLIFANIYLLRSAYLAYLQLFKHLSIKRYRQS